jgi:TonB family protein
MDKSLGLMLRFKWGEQQVHGALLRPSDARAGFTVGSAKGVDFACGDIEGTERFELVAPGDTRTVRFMRGMQGTLWRGDEAISLQDAVTRGDAVPDGGGYAVSLSRQDAVSLKLSGVDVEAVPVRVPERVAADPLERLDLRMLNIFGVVFIGAMIAIASAIADEGAAGFRDDDNTPQSKSMARFVVPQTPPKVHARSAAPAERAERSKEPAAREGRAANKNARLGKPPPGQIAQQLSQALHGLAAGLPDAQLTQAIGVLRANGTVSDNGFGGITLKGDGTGGCATCTTLSIGALPKRGHGGGGDPFGDGPGHMGNKEKLAPEPFVTDIKCIGLDKDLIRQVIHAHRSEVRYCYDLALTSNPQLRGKTAVKFVIGPSGAVSTASVSESTAHELDDCVSSRVRSWVFPKPPGGGTAIVTYPFVFNHD